ncbi:MAG: TIGR00730 family Rossman fold protein [Bryobacteraceae bacterium]
MKNICVFCGSNTGVRQAYADTTVALGRALAAGGIGLVYGGGNVGLMGVLADAVLAAGGEVTGVIPRALKEKEVAHLSLTALHVVGSMHERKALMADLSDGFIALPGGYGTFDEFCEVLTWTQLRIQQKACGLLNIEGYYDALLSMFDHAENEGFLKPEHRRLIVSDTDVDGLLQRMKQFVFPAAEKWLQKRPTGI